MRSLGATDCVPKPFEWDDLIGRIEELAGNLTVLAAPRLLRAISIRICLPFSFVPSRYSTARSA